MKFKIAWIEEIELTDEALKGYVKTKHLGDHFVGRPYYDDVCEFKCVRDFEAEDINSAMQYVEDNYTMDVFSVSRCDTGIRVFTEEDFE